MRVPDRWLSTACLLAAQGIDTPDAGAVRGNVEEKEAKKNRGVALIRSRQSAVRLVEHKIGDGHSTACNECRNTGKESDEYQQSGQKLDHAADVEKCCHKGSQLRLGHASRARRKTKKQLAAVTHKEESGDDSKNGVNIR